MTYPYLLRWSTRESTTLERDVLNARELRRSFETVTLEAQYAGVVCEVDLVPLDPQPAEPLLVQFLVGHPTTSRVTVHRDTGTHFVREPGFTEVAAEVLVVRGTGTAPAEPGTLMVPGASVLNIVDAICTRNRLPGHVEVVDQSPD